MKQRYFLLLFCICRFVTVNAQPSSSHYSLVDGKQGVELLNAISVCAGKGYKSLGYKGLWDAFQYSDTHEDGTIWDMYGDCEFIFSKNQCGNYTNECDCYNREHTVPKSWWGGSESNQGCDLFILVPTDGKVNGMRSNYPFGEVSNATYTYNGSKLGNSSMSGYSGTVFEPIDEYKGDFARGILGAMVKWTGTWTQAEGNSTFNGNYTSSDNYGLTSYGVALLMKWHRQDPVSKKELDRNNGIEHTQGNRNPFIDYPELAEYLWGTKKNQTVNLASLHCSYGELTGIDITYALNRNIQIHTEQGTLTFSSSVPLSVSIFDMFGRLVAMSESTTDWSVQLPQGVYVLRAGEQSMRVMVY